MLPELHPVTSGEAQRCSSGYSASKSVFHKACVSHSVRLTSEIPDIAAVFYSERFFAFRLRNRAYRELSTGPESLGVTKITLIQRVRAHYRAYRVAQSLCRIAVLPRIGPGSMSRLGTSNALPDHGWSTLAHGRA